VEQKTRAWAEIDLEALARNCGWLRDRAAGRRLIAVVKANAYGHGAVPVSRALVRAGCDALAVVTLEEARELREARISAPLLLLTGPLTPEQGDELLALRVVPTLTQSEQLEVMQSAAQRAGVRAPVHLKLDTGMGRLGFLPGDLSAILERLAAAEDLVLDGVMSHLAEVDDPISAVTERQRKVFGELLAKIREAGFDPDWIHLDNSAGVVRGSTPGTNAVRPGLMLYGADPTLEGGNELEPVMTLCTRVCQAKDVSAGARIGYGGTFEAAGPTRILTLSIGYADGLPRAAGNRFRVGHRGRRVPLVGRVSCDLATVDTGPGGEGKVGDEVLLFGRRDGLEIRVEELAEAVGTISYEILVRIGERIPRLIT
jgi:alanine racemase